jgi:hypothetical protein
MHHLTMGYVLTNVLLGDFVAVGTSECTYTNYNATIVLGDIVL